jgi:hypothetical protein
MKATTAICLAAMLGGAVLMTPPTFAESPTKAAFTQPAPGPSSVCMAHRRIDPVGNGALPIAATPFRAISIRQIGVDAVR